MSWLALAGLSGATLGVATAYAQGWLPDELGSLANSSGTWALLAFLLALPATNVRMAAVLGFVALVTLLVGYALGVQVRGDSASSALFVFWGLAALIAGPVLGLCAYWLKTRLDPLAAVGIGVMVGVLNGEGVYGLRYIAGTTYPPYWWGEIIVGVALLCWVAVARLRDLKLVAVAVISSVVVAAAFVALYSQDLISRLS